MSTQKNKRNDQIKELRKKGTSLEKIGEEYGLSRERVRQICGSRSYGNILEKKLLKIPYIGLRNWLRDTGYSMSEMCIKMGYSDSNTSRVVLSNYFSGKSTLKKDQIDKLIKITNMSYEELFKE